FADPEQPRQGGEGAEGYPEESDFWGRGAVGFALDVDRAGMKQRRHGETEDKEKKADDPQPLPQEDPNVAGRARPRPGSTQYLDPAGRVAGLLLSAAVRFCWLARQEPLRDGARRVPAWRLSIIPGRRPGAGGRLSLQPAQEIPARRAARLWPGS